ncbi:hypothetical protein FB451DRAFT_1173514 [Mycena latifolia]|nr:hypothetical protein FB451DRAFT_1173514 [Mycena latifolia]
MPAIAFGALGARALGFSLADSFALLSPQGLKNHEICNPILTPFSLSHPPVSPTPPRLRWYLHANTESAEHIPPPSKSTRSQWQMSLECSTSTGWPGFFAITFSRLDDPNDTADASLDIIRAAESYFSPGQAGLVAPLRWDIRGWSQNYVAVKYQNDAGGQKCDWSGYGNAQCVHLAVAEVSAVGHAYPIDPLDMADMCSFTGPDGANYTACIGSITNGGRKQYSRVDCRFMKVNHISIGPSAQTAPARHHIGPSSTVYLLTTPAQSSGPTL